MGDSAAMPEEYAKRAVELGHKVISSVEHGWQGYYHQTFELAKKYGLKFVFGTEAYWVKNRLEKDRSNNHMIILAKNENGRRAINRILSEANETGYFYKPRVDFELIFSLPAKDVFITSACVGFWEYEDTDDIVLRLHDYFQDNFMLEIQYHNTETQKLLNKHIKQLSEEYNIQMIVGLDSHYIYQEQSVERDDILAGRNIKFDDNEIGWYMDYPDDSTIIKRFVEQGIFNIATIQKAMNNTDLLLEFGDYDDVPVFTTNIKLPTLYPDKTQEERNKIYSSLISKLFKEYMKNVPKEQYKEYFEGVKQEVSVYKETGMVDYPLLDYEIIKRGVEKGGLITTTGRGSAVGYFTNTLCGFSKVDRFTSPIKLYPERFISKTRILETKSLPDLDMNLGTVEIFAEAQEEILGKDHAYPMIAFGTLKKKSAFKLYARANNLDFEIANEISKQIDKYDEAVKYADDDEKDDIDIYEYVDEKYKDYIEQSEKYWGVISDKKKAPCAYLLYQGSIREEIGLIKCKSETTKKEYITTVIDGAVAEKYKFLKNDLLKVDVVLLIDMIYKRIGIPVHSASEIISLVDGNKKVWDLYANGYTIGVNQCEKESAMKKLRKYKPKNISELCAWIAAIRPAFKSMYSKFESRESFEYGIRAFDKILQTPQFPYSYILYQEQTMNTLNYAGFPLDECYGIIKAIAKKHPEKVKPLKDRFIEGFKNKIMQDDHIEEDKAAEMSARVWQIIDDSCGYGFNSAHAYCMAIDSLYCAYLKAHYTYEFYEVLLQVFSDKGKKDKVQALKQEMLTAFGIREGEYKFGVDNRRFVADKEKGVIYPSLLSIKGLSQGCADELYELSQEKTFDNFYDLWQAVNSLPSLNCAKIDTLIKMNYFKDYGSMDKIQKFIRAIDILHGKSQFNKDKMPIGFESIIKKYTEETEKQYRKFDYDSALREIWDMIPNTEPSLYKIIHYQNDLYGYISYTDSSKISSAVIIDIDTRYGTFKAQLYRLYDGQTITVKLKKKIYEQMPIAIGMVIDYKIDKQPAWKLGEDGKWQKDYSREDTWLTHYTVEQ
jgi:DNA polymerase III alpha subunit